MKNIHKRAERKPRVQITAQTWQVIQDTLRPHNESVASPQGVFIANHERREILRRLQEQFEIC